MCGIFGFVRNGNAKDKGIPSAVLKELGIKSISRGKDSSGLAFIPLIENALAPSELSYKESSQEKLVEFDNIVISKNLVPFDEFWLENFHFNQAFNSQVVIGHTRRATQGSSFDMSNSSPLLIGNIIGTHNGDVDKHSSVFSDTDKEDLFGGTDTEILYRHIDSQDSCRADIVNSLTEIPGRMALAWIDRSRPGRLYLARAAFSPLAVAWDFAGNLYWASNPSWFREIDHMFDGTVGFRDITLINEGQLLTVEYGDVEPVIADVRAFVPIARHSDESTADIFVWKGFSDQDERTDKESLIHRIAPREIATTPFDNMYNFPGNRDDLHSEYLFGQDFLDASLDRDWRDKLADDEKELLSYEEECQEHEKEGDIVDYVLDLFYDEDINISKIVEQTLWEWNAKRYPNLVNSQINDLSLGHIDFSSFSKSLGFKNNIDGYRFYQAVSLINYVSECWDNNDAPTLEFIETVLLADDIDEPQLLSTI